MTTDKIEPALSARQWSLRAARLPVDSFGLADVYGFRVEGAEGQGLRLEIDVFDAEHPNDTASHEVQPEALPKLIALANDALPYSDDRKFRHHWVSWLREEAEILKRNGAGAGALMATQIADALASYLPPE